MSEPTTAEPLAADEALMRYLADREQARFNATQTTWHAMTRPEQRLFREAAVMGYVLAVRQHAPHGTAIPRDMAVVAQVIDAIHAFDDLYPFTAGLSRRRARRGGRDEL